MSESSLEFMLPGGLVHEDTRVRRGRLRPITGRLELALARAGGDDRPTRVDRLLAIAVERLGELGAPAALGARLCPGDREYLLVRLAAALRGRQQWLSASCRGCGELLDLSLDLGELPMSEAGAGYPRCALEVDGRTLVVRVPLGEDVVASGAARTLDERVAARALLLRCVVAIDGQPPTETQLEGLSTAALERIDVALDELCPAIASRLETVCPDCGAARELELDPLELLGQEPDDALFEEVHALAMAYHWTEGQILGLPRDRRRLYLGLVDRDRGMSGEVAP
jgi:hypothetical protein